VHPSPALHPNDVHWIASLQLWLPVHVTSQAQD
jgi:hypothetical protein